MANNINMEFFHSLTTAFNGFSGKVKYADIEIIERLPQVKKVYIANEYERPDIKPDMNTSNDMIGALETPYKGENTVIAIIDTGIDPDHRDMKLSEGTETKLTKEIVEGMDLLGKYYTEKVPYGYNYYDLNDEILDLGPDASMHGMHVAGTAGANGDPENGGVRGVAPEAQLLAMKVFSNDPIYATTFSDIYLVAIDEAIKLGADVLNMSLGSTAAFYIPESPEDVAITNATNAGIVCAVSAGNSAQMTDGYWYPWKEHPDIGVSGSPGLNKDTIQVASIENTHMMANYLTYEGEDGPVKVQMAIAGNIDPSKVFDGPMEFVDGGSGHPSELPEDVEGKIVLAIRGGLTGPFVEKIENAQDAGAAGIIVYNHEDGGEDLVNMATPSVQTIPAVFIGNSGGTALLGLENKFVSFPEETMSIPNPNGGEMSDFTSWGTTPSLDFKPEITAPGGQIYSTLNDDQYGTMSGTSMAAPHVAGGAAVVRDYIEKSDKYKGLSEEEKARLSKVLLMNTAEIIFDEYETEYSPRRQGAGLMRLDRAVATPVRIVEYNTNEAKVALRDFDTKTFTMKFKAINDGDTEVSYKVDATVLKDFILNYEGEDINLLAADYINANVTTNLNDDILIIPAGEEKTFEVTVDISGDDTIYRNMFVEGFVTLEDINDTHPDLSVPFVGFYGDWTEPKVLDSMEAFDGEGTSYFGISGLGFIKGTSIYIYNSPKIYINPGTDIGAEEGTDHILPILSFMRNAEEVNYNVLDEDGNVLRTILSQNFVRKNYLDGGRRNPYTIGVNALWDGTVKGQVVPDGDYFYEITTKVHYPGAEFQSKKLPISIDTTGPEITDLKYDPETGKLTWNSVDEGIGIAGFMFEINGELLDDVVLGEKDKSDYEFDIGEYIGDLGEYEITVISVDGLLNMNEETITYLAGDNEEPYIYILEPGLLEAYDESDVLFEGYVANYHALDKVIIDGEIEADIEFKQKVTLTHPDNPSTVLYTGPAYKFSKLVHVEDGYNEIKVEAISKTGSVGSLVRRFYVDTTPPELEIELKEFNAEEMTADLEITMSDNLDYLRLMLYDSQIYSYSGPLLKAEPVEETIAYTVDLEEENVFLFTLYDTVGHEDVKKIQITEDGELIFLDPDVDPTDGEPMENLPSNTVIIGDTAYDIRYLNNNEEAQLKLIEWYSKGEEIYIKLSDSLIVNIRGEEVDIDELPEELVYYDRDGRTIKYVK